MDDIEKVKQKIDVVDLIGSYLQLKKAGRNFKANCPFHGEKTPSFVISPERQIWHCFGCHKGGDAFTFVTDYENITFAEALKELAERAGVKLTAPAARTEKEKKQELIYSLNHLSAQYYNYLLLNHPSGKKALEYLLEKRKLTIPLIKTFMLGYAPGSFSLSNYLVKKKGYAQDDLVSAGLVFKRDNYVFDFFKERIIFPIHDARGNVVAFSGRGMNDTTMPKYVNTRETPAYIKGDTLFGLNLAKEGIRHEGKVIIVEGEFDVITSYKEGITNVVAVKGTALTENQIRLLKRFAPRFVFCFDTDPAGTEAQRRSIQLIEKEGITATVITPPSGKDPDELLNEDPVLFKKAVKDEKNIYDFLIDSAVSQFDKTTADGKKNILEKTLPYLSIIENEVIKEHYLRKLAHDLDTSTEAVSRQADKIKRPDQNKATTQQASKQAQLPQEEIREIYLLSLIFQSDRPQENLKQVREVLTDVPLSTPALDKVLKNFEKYEFTGEFSPRAFVEFLPSELHLPFDTAFLAPVPEFKEKEQFVHELNKITAQVRTFAIKKRLTSLTELITTAEREKNEEKLTNYEEEFSKLSKLLST